MERTDILLRSKTVRGRTVTESPIKDIVFEYSEFPEIDGKVRLIANGWERQSRDFSLDLPDIMNMAYKSAPNSYHNNPFLSGVAEGLASWLTFNRFGQRKDLVEQSAKSFLKLLELAYLRTLSNGKIKNEGITVRSTKTPENAFAGGKVYISYSLDQRLLRHPVASAFIGLEKTSQRVSYISGIAFGFARQIAEFEKKEKEYSFIEGEIAEIRKIVRIAGSVFER